MFFKSLLLSICLPALICSNAFGQTPLVEKTEAQNKWAAQGFFQAGYSPFTEINNNYSNTALDLTSNFDFAGQGVKNQHFLWGAEFDLLYQFRIPYLVGAGFAFTLDSPGSLDVKKQTREEFLKISYSLASYLLHLKLGQEFYRGRNFFIRGFLEPKIGVGRLVISENVSGADFGESRQNTSTLQALAWGLSISIDTIWRFNIRNGMLFGLRAGFTSYNSFRGNDAFGNSGRLIRVPLSNDTSKEVYKFLQDGREIPGDQEDATFLLSEFVAYLGYWQAL